MGESIFFFIVIVAGMAALVIGTTAIFTFFTVIFILPSLFPPIGYWNSNKFTALTFVVFILYAVPFFLLYNYLLHESRPW